MQWLSEISAWHWASLGIILLILETLGAAGFLIGSAIAAFLMAAVISIAPDLNWKWQLAIFSSSAIIFSVIYLKRFANFNENSDQPNLNNRAALHIGKRIQLKEPVINGEGRVQIGDTFWKIKSPDLIDIDIEHHVEVTNTEGMTLIVKEIKK